MLKCGFSLTRILSLCGRIRVSENPYCRIFYAVFLQKWSTVLTIFAKKIFIICVWQVSKYALVQHCWWLQLKATTQRRQNGTKDKDLRVLKSRFQAFFQQVLTGITAQKMKFSIKDFLSKCDQIRSFLRI